MWRRERQADHNRAGEEERKPIKLRVRKGICVGLTVDVVDGESVGEVGHVGLLSERSFLLWGLLRAAIIQTLNGQKKKKIKCVQHPFHIFACLCAKNPIIHLFSAG